MKTKTSRTSRKLRVNKTKKLHELFRCSLSGVQYSDYQNAYVRDYIKHGSKVQLYWETRNPYDQLAIKVCYHGRKIGYIPRDGYYQKMLHDYRKMGIRIDGEIVSVNHNNPTWYYFVIKCSSIRKINSNIPDTIML